MTTLISFILGKLCHFIMEKMTLLQRLQIVQLYFENCDSVTQTQRWLCAFGSFRWIIEWTTNRFRSSYTLVDNTHLEKWRTVRQQLLGYTLCNNFWRRITVHILIRSNLCNLSWLAIDYVWGLLNGRRIN